MVEKIHTPSDIRSMSDAEIRALAAEIREAIIGTVAENGGHLASNLGMVEATIALHRVFDSPEDSIVFDVGHQCYAHKLLTGRSREFSTLRRYGGISGFTRRGESEHDILSEGHSGASVSAALGIATANKLKKNGRYAVAVVGDGSLTNGMIYEALNNCADKQLDLVIVINDNEMSISHNVGGLNDYLARIRTSSGYFSFKRRFEHCLSAIPVVGVPFAKALKLIKDAVRRLFIKDTLFEDLGLVYLGPVDGHDVEKLTRVFDEAKSKHRCTVVHIITEKGRGYIHAEREPDKYHSVGSFDVSAGAVSNSGESFSARMGDMLCTLAKNDERICAVTAAMRDGTGLARFAREYPERFFDVGIAEEHAVTFAGGLAAAGMLPAVALYSTFSQRVYDQVLHDVSIQGLPMLLLLDRCGIVAGDGITHQGIFDYPLFSSVPGVTIYSPESYCELEYAMAAALDGRQLAIIRYPKGCEHTEHCTVLQTVGDGCLCHTEGVSECETVIVTYGRMTREACRAAALLGGGRMFGVIKLTRIYPIDTDAILSLTKNARLVYILEEGVRSGGFGEKLAAAYAAAGAGCRVVINAIDGYLPHGDAETLTKACGLDAESVARDIGSLTV